MSAPFEWLASPTRSQLVCGGQRLPQSSMQSLKTIGGDDGLSNTRNGANTAVRQFSTRRCRQSHAHAHHSPIHAVKLPPGQAPGVGGAGGPGGLGAGGVGGVPPG